MLPHRNQSCDVQKSQCLLGEKCIDGTCQYVAGSVDVGGQCVQDTDCSTHKCQALDADTAHRALLPHAPKVCVVGKGGSAPHKSDFQFLQ